jgi:hypothetical protein
LLEKTVLAALLRESAWVRYGSLFDAHFFTTEAYRTLFTCISDFWTGYEGEADTIPADLLDAKIEATYPDNEAVLKRTADELYETDLDPVLLDGLVKDVLARWRTKDYLVSAAQEMETGALDLHALSAKFHTLAAAVDKDEEVEASLVEDSMSILNTETIDTVYPTGLSELDAQLRGGLWVQEEGVLIAPSHRGKTWALVSFGATALSNGTPVQHYTLEISRNRVAIRYYQSLLGEGRQWILSNPSGVKDRLEQKGIPAWSVKDLSGGGATTAHVRKHVAQFVDTCDSPPLIIIDYLDLLAPADRRLEGRHALTAVAQELREIASEFGVGLWTATQANRPSWQSQHIRMSDVSEAIGKVEKADVVVTMNQTTEEFNVGTMRFYIDKARERVLTQREVPALALREEQQFRDLPDGFDQFS